MFQSKSSIHPYILVGMFLDVLTTLNKILNLIYRISSSEGNISLWILDEAFCKVLWPPSITLIEVPGFWIRASSTFECTSCNVY
jgi:hypothetical protein